MEDEQDGQSHINMFSDDKKVQGVLSAEFGDGWETSLPVVDTVCSDEVAYGRHKSDRKNLESEVNQHIYPPAIPFVVKYNSLPDCSTVAKMEKLSIKGTSKGRIAFPFQIYQVKTPHPPSSPLASPSSSMGGCPTLPPPMDTGDEDLPQGDDAILSEKVSDHPRHLMLFRRHISRRATGKGRAVLEGVGLDVPTIAACFTAHPSNEEGAVQEGLTKWCAGAGFQPPTWGVLVEATLSMQILPSRTLKLSEELSADLAFNEGT